MKDGHSLKVGKLASLGLAGLSSVLNAILPTKDKAGLLTNEGWWPGRPDHLDDCDCHHPSKQKRP